MSSETCGCVCYNDHWFLKCVAHSGAYCSCNLLQGSHTHTVKLFGKITVNKDFLTRVY
jgi:hypothetical protein